jgi:hypothetical protein
VTLDIGSISLDETQSTPLLPGRGICTGITEKRNRAARALPTGRELSLTTQLTA